MPPRSRPASSVAAGVRLWRRQGSRVLLAEAVGEGKILPAPALEEGARFAPDGFGTREHRPLPTLLAHEDDAPLRTWHLKTPLCFVVLRPLGAPFSRVN